MPRHSNPSTTLPAFAGILYRHVALLLRLVCGVALVLTSGNWISVQAEDTGDGPLADKAEEKIIREIEIRGVIRVGTGDVQKMIRTRVGRPFDARQWDEDWHKLIDSGLFANVRVTPPLEFPGGVKLVIDLVELAVINKIKFKNFKAIKEATLLEAIKSKVGGRFQQGQVHQDAQILETKYKDEAFREAKVSYSFDVVASHEQLVAGKLQQVPDEVVIIFTVDEGNPISVQSIKFEGNKSFSDEVLIAEMQSKPRRLFRPGDLKDSQLEVDRKLLERFYLKNGFIDISVDKVDVKVSEETYWNWFRKRKKMADVTITVTEGSQYHTGKVEIEGNKNIETHEIEQAMRVKPGSVYSDLILHEDTRRIKELYGEYGRGFTEVEISSKVVTDPERLKKSPNLYDAKLVIHESPELTVRNIYARGNIKTKEKVIIRNVPLFPGDRVDTTRLKYAKDALKRLDYFDENSIRVELEPTDNPEEADVVVDVAEKSTGEFNFGAGISSNTGVMGNVSLTQRNFDWADWPKSLRDFITGNSFVGGGQRASFSASVGTKTQNYNISYMEPWAFDRPIRIGGSIFRQVDNTYQDFNQTNTGFSITVGRRLWSPRWDADATYSFSYTEIGDTRSYLPPIFQDQKGHRILSSLRPRLVYDSRNGTIQPSQGIFMEAAVEVGGGPFFGDVNWIRPTLDIARYFTTYKVKGGGKHILELHASTGMIEQYGSTKEIQPFQRFYGGGIGSVRGFENHTIAPLENGYLVGAKKYWLASAEYSVPVYEEVVRLLAFSDVGDYWDGGKADDGAYPGEYTITNRNGVRASVGMGIAVRTPFSPMPLRLYFSKPISKNDQDRTKTIDFTFGTRF